MKKLFITLIVICGITNSSLSQSKSKNQKIKILLELSDPKGSVYIIENFDKVLIPEFQKIYKFDNPQFWVEIVKDFQKEEIINNILNIYGKYYTEEEIDQLILFYKSNLGQKMLSSSVLVYQELTNYVQSWNKEYNDKLVIKLQENGWMK